MEAPYASRNLVLPSAQNAYAGSLAESLRSNEPNTAAWYRTQYGCLKDDPTLIARRHTFPDAGIPRGLPFDPAAATRNCLQYETAWPQGVADAGAMVDMEREHPQFAFNGGGPGTVSQIDVESQLRRLDQPLVGGGCQAVLADDAPLYRNTVAPPMMASIPAGPQNAANPLAAVILPGMDACRVAADQVAMAMSGRWLHNPTRQDTMRFDKPFSPPGIGSGQARGPRGAAHGPYFS